MLAAVLGGLTMVLLGVAPAPAHAARTDSDVAPLTVTVDTLTPSALRPRGSGVVTVTGTVTNADDATWRDVSLYPFRSLTPMTTMTELAQAAETDETAEVGERIVTDRVAIGDLQPGQTISYTLLVPRQDLPTDPGVYWFGVHALGSGPDGYDSVADGRARTFLPVVSGRTTPVRAAVLVPVRAHVTRNPDGSVAALGSWQRLLSATGRLGRLREAASTPGGRSLSWLVDPAVLDALQQLAAGNPARNLAPTAKPPAGASDSPSPTPTPTPSADADSDGDGNPKPSPEAAATAAVASGWLDAMLPMLRESEVLALPYGDTDEAAAAVHDPKLYATARSRSAAFFDGLGINALQVSAPPRGVTSAAALQMTDPASPTVLSDTALPEELAWGQDSAPPVVSAGSWRIAVSSSEAASGGPGPGDPLADVPLRQRVLAEAAVRALDPAQAPLIVTLPDRWRPADPAGFVQGLSQPWLQVAGLSAATAGQVAPQIDPKALRYPSSSVHDELTGRSFLAAEALIRTGRSLQRVLTRNDTVASEVVDEALTTLGHSARVGGTNDEAVASRGWIETQLAGIRVQAPSAVTLSGSSGRFAATVVNGLDEPVTVAIHALTDPGIAISAPKSVQVAGSGRATVLLDASQAQAGVHNVSLQIVDTQGERTGGSAYVPIRAAQVSKIIWLFLAVGGALLFGAIAVRLVRRVRTARA
ncbi:hypothetical protein JCM18899A_40220 [Nocardioides sp. AN3]